MADRTKPSITIFSSRERTRPAYAARIANEKRNRRLETAKEKPVRLTTNGHLICKIDEPLLPDHGRAEEAQHLTDRIRDRIGAAAGKKQTNRPRIGRHVFHHE